MISKHIFATQPFNISDRPFSAPAPIDLLYELRCKRPDLFDKIEVMMDGGVRSGADVVKAIALGAKAVGIGRSFLYANGTHGEEGVVRLCQSESCLPIKGALHPWLTCCSPCGRDHKYNEEHRCATPGGSQARDGGPGRTVGGEQCPSLC